MWEAYRSMGAGPDRLQLPVRVAALAFQPPGWQHSVIRGGHVCILQHSEQRL
jgi:hypothetical protein